MNDQQLVFIIGSIAAIIAGSLPGSQEKLAGFAFGMFVLSFFCGD